MAAEVVSFALQLLNQGGHVRVGDAVRGLAVDVVAKVVVRHDEERDVGQGAQVHEPLEGAPVGEQEVEQAPGDHLDEGHAQVDAREEDEAADVAEWKFNRFWPVSRRRFSDLNKERRI